MAVQVARIISKYTRGGLQMAQVVIHRGQGSDRRSETRHIQLSSVKDGEKMRRVWVGNNPDPQTVGRRNNAARLVANADANYSRLQEEITGFEKLAGRELTTEELEMFRRQGFTTAEKIKEVVGTVVIPTLKLQLQAAKMACDTAKAFQAEVNEAFPLTVEFVGL